MELNKNAEVKVKEKKGLLFAIIGVGIILILAVIIGVIALGGSDSRKVQEQLDLGAKYLEEMDYEQALVAYQAALEIDPKNVDAYLGIVEVYIRTNNFENALKYAQEGYEVIWDERLKEKIDMIEGGNIFATNGWSMKMSGYDGERNLVYWHEYTYNLKGQKASVGMYNIYGVQEQYLELTYDEEGRPLISYNYDLRIGQLDKCVYEYHDNGYRKTYYEGTSDVVDDYYEEETDADGRTLKNTHYDADGRIFGTKVYEYDDSGKLIRRSDYWGEENRLGNYNVYTYDEDGRQQQSQEYKGNGELVEYAEWIYDEMGKAIGVRSYNANSELVYYKELIYDEEGNFGGQRVYNGDGTLDYEIIDQ